MDYVKKTFLMVRSSDRSKQLLCFVHGQGQKCKLNKELWHGHIDYICNKASKSVNVIAKLKPHVTSRSLTSIYYALIYPYLTYGCVLWGNNYELGYHSIATALGSAMTHFLNLSQREFLPHPTPSLLYPLPT